ncbi:MAG: V-type ATP synthase subunit B [Kiritimatiellia bacterium]|jgi:V/A-type H+-transporting ATPase subunit B|nr:V-type ATP synthase subunit B [Kiritimatiellia bacterium]MDP6810048.1 V-type ATP synthase subunit B [Kiritimatiellia bacterium]MDP7024819.1 V-type ATP synthase subunit B [Kiritimatiellia bacterium]
MHKVYHRVHNIAGNVINIRAEGVRYRELAEVTSRTGTSLAQVIRLQDDEVSLQVFAGARGVATDAQVRFLGHSMQVPYSEALLGRIFTGAANPRDRGPELAENLIEIGGPSVNPAKRIIPRNMVRTGIPMIDVFNTLVESQKLPIFARAGEPYNPLLARIALQAEVDVIVLGGMGLKHDDYLYFRDTLEESGALSRTVMFVHTASDPIVECLLVPDISLAVAEQFALEGKRVLCLLTDMTSFADAMKEIAITMEQIPSNRGYPGDLYSQLASRYEKAVDFDGAGSITILAATTMPGDDVTHPVPDNTGYITEGQFYLRDGRIEPFGSLSRLKQQVNGDTRDDHRTIMDTLVQLYAAYRETLEKQSMGFRMSDWDEKLLKYGDRFEKEMMDLTVNIPLEGALDLGWQILADCFEPMETGIQSSLIDAFWPRSASQSEASSSAEATEDKTPGKPDEGDAEEDTPAEAEDTEAKPEPETVEA